MKCPERAGPFVLSSNILIATYMPTLPNERNPAEVEIRALIEDLAEGIRAKNVNQVMSHYAAERVQFLLAPPLQYSGANAVKDEDLEEWFSSSNGPIGYEIRDLQVATDNQIAFCHALNRMSGTKVDGEKTALWLRWTVCFRKIGGKWQITHEHESVPFYMDGSDKAALDLKP
jgi:ketosteroid isomerase-like protein